MNGAAAKQPEPSGEHGPTACGEQDSGSGSFDAGVDAEGLYTEIERFSSLSSALKDCLLGITLKINDVLNACNAVQRSVQRKRAELEQMYGIEASAAALDKLAKQHRVQKESFESFMQEQRRLWEEEVQRRDREDAMRREALNLSLGQQEQEDARKRAEEQAVFREKLEEERVALMRESLERYAERERVLDARERALGEKEGQLACLIEELDRLMARLAARTRSGVLDAQAPGVRPAEGPARPEPPDRMQASAMGSDTAARKMLWPQSGEAENQQAGH